MEENISTKIKVAILSFSLPIVIQPRMAEKLRGYFGRLYPEENLFHNHTSDGKDIYRYPKIQYKTIGGRLSIVGLNEGAELVQNEFIKHEKVVIDHKEYSVLESRLETRQEEFTVCDELLEYHFISPWLALNEKNHALYLRGELNLDRALTNNLLSDLKGLSIRANKKIMVKGRFTPGEVMLDDTAMTGFRGDFVCNMKIPQYIGTGKRKSIGFGVIEKYRK